MKRKYLQRTIIFTVLFSLLSTFFAAALEGNIVASSKASVENSVISFNESDFFEDKDSSTVVITELPDPTLGTLLLNGEEVLIFQSINKSDIQGLKFVPVMDVPGEAYFCFKEVTPNGFSPESLKVSLSLLSTPPAIPTTKDVTFDTKKNMTLFGDVAIGGTNENLTVKIIKKPKSGDISFTDKTNPLSFKYVPHLNKTGKDSFTFMITDSKGNMSDVAKATINIEKDKETIRYSDMTNYKQHYAAVKLAEKGILTGTKIGNSNFFYPDESVSKADFLVMLMGVMGEDKDLPFVQNTGFADDSEIPKWMKRYVGLAKENGIISGTQSEDQTQSVFNPNVALNRAQASVMINNALSLESVTTSTKVYTDTVPAWAVSSLANAETNGILDVFSDGSANAEQTLTRADVAQILYNVSKYMEEEQAKENKGFFDFLLFWK